MRWPLVADPTEGWAERAAERLAGRWLYQDSHSSVVTALTSILRQLEADEAALAMIPSVASHAQRMDALASLRALKRSLGVEE